MYTAGAASSGRYWTVGCGRTAWCRRDPQIAGESRAGMKLLAGYPSTTASRRRAASSRWSLETALRAHEPGRSSAESKEKDGGGRAVQHIPGQCALMEGGWMASSGGADAAVALEEIKIINHGVDETIVENVKDNTTEFFKLPLEKKKAVGTIKADHGFQGYGHHFNTSTGKLDWAESLLLLGVQPILHRNMDFWPTDPTTFRETLDKYSSEMTKLTSLLVASMATDLGVKRETMLETIQGKVQNIIFHRYPPCHHGADKVVGIAPHTDSFCLTVLLQLDTTPGLQVSKDGKWFPVRPLPGCFTIFVGNILEVLTNGRYKSVEHRVLVHPERGRTTIVAFQDACVTGVVKPLPELEEEARYKSIKKNDYRHRQLQALEERERFIDSLKI